MATVSLKIRPYARLLTMLGEQLIKNEQIALAELIKNSYDADADWVKVSFVDFKQKDNSEEIEATQGSKIIIEDNGCGMDLETIRNSWMNPATPNKKAKEGSDIIKTPKGRVVQGEKGIGRFAILKLGRDTTITTRPLNSDKEYVIKYNLSQYDDDFLTEDGQNKELFIDDISVDVIDRAPECIILRDVVVNNTRYEGSRNVHGTKIEITNLKGSWSKQKINIVSKESQKLESIFDKIFRRESKDSFEIGFELNDGRFLLSDNVIEKLSTLLNYSAVFKITDGIYDENRQVFTYKLNDIPISLPLSDPRISGLTVFKEYFLRDKDLFGNSVLRKSECGSFKFNFFIFDFAADRNSSYYLDREDKELIKEHRIYLYRDKIRVAPYGDPDNDWLETDKKRGTGRTGDYLSNDQVVGFVDITKKDNPNLKDKTNREGLIDTGNATRDFIMLLHSFLLFIRQHPYEQYKNQIRQQKEQKTSSLKIVENKFDTLKEYVKDNATAFRVYSDLVKSYKIERDFYNKSLNATEELAGVGLSVETASHDMMMMLSKGLDGIDSLVKDVSGEILSTEELENELLSLRGVFSFVYDQMKDIQLLFRSSKQRRREIRVADLLAKVQKIYKRSLQREKISLEIQKIGSPVVAKCTDAVILQLFINLFDNAIYWLSVIDLVDKKIVITLDGNKQQVVFSDNGPGIHSEDIPYIFEAFYSGKEEGRGLGLYIARQLLERMGYSIELADFKTEKVLSGANFVINFLKKEDNE